MRMLIIGFVAFLCACNGSGNSTPGVTQADIQAAIAPLQAKVNALQASNDALKAGQAKLTLIGKLHGVSTDAIGRMVDAVGNPVSFGPCADMGVLLGRGDNPFSQDPLSAIYESFQQCTGYEYSVTVATKTVAVGPRLFWDGPNCTGKMYEWNSGGGSYNDQALDGGVVFLSPLDNSSLMVASGQIPSPVLMQSVWVTSNPGCQSDVETQNLYKVTQNDPSVTGVPMMSIGQFQLGAP